MLIKPIDLEDEPFGCDQSLPPGSMEYTPDVRQVGPLAVQGEATSSSSIAATRRPSTTSASAPPTRATSSSSAPAASSPSPLPLSGDFDLIFRPEAADARLAERAITPDETEIGYYEESGLSLEDVVREQVLLSLPGRTLCKDGLQRTLPALWPEPEPCNLLTAMQLRPIRGGMRLRVWRITKLELK